MESLADSLYDNERFKKPSSDNDNVKGNKISDDQAELRAYYLTDKLHATKKSWEYLIKVSYRLPEGTVNQFLATALEKGRNPLALFIHLTNREMSRRGK